MNILNFCMPIYNLLLSPISRPSEILEHYIFILEDKKIRRLEKLISFAGNVLTFWSDILLLWKNIHPEFPNIFVEINPRVQLMLESCDQLNSCLDLEFYRVQFY